MASINSSSRASAPGGIYGSLVAKNKGLGGLATGLDTDALVEALTSGTRSKIAKQGQQKQLLNWKMTAYRNAASVLRAFKDTHFNLLKPDSYIGSNSFFNSFKGVSSSDAVKLLSSSTTAGGTVKIASVSSLATAQTITTQKFEARLEGAASGELYTQDYTGKTMTVDVEGNVKTVELDSLNGLSGADFQAELQRLMDETFGKRSNGTSNVQVQLQEDGGAASVRLSSDTDLIVVVEGDALGFAKESRNRISTQSSLRDLFGSDLKGDTLSFKINGTEFSFSADDKLSKVMADISNSGANVKVAYSTLTQSFTFTATTTGVGNNIDMRDISGNLLNVWVGAKGGNRMESRTMYTSRITADGALALPANADDLDGMTFAVTVNGTSNVYSLKLSDEQKQQITDGSLSITQAVQDTLNRQAGENLPDGALSFSVQDGKLVLASNTNAEMRVWASTTDSAKNALTALGFSGEKKNSLLGIRYGDTISGGTLSPSDNPLKDMQGKVLSMNLVIGSTAKAIEITVDEYVAGLEDGQLAFKWLENQLNAELKAEFGTAASAVSFDISDTGDVKLNIAGGSTNVYMEAPDLSGDPDKTSLYALLGFSGTSTDNQNGGQSTPLRELNINGPVSFELNGKTFSFEEDATIQDVIGVVNAALGGSVLRLSGGKLTLDAAKADLSFRDTAGNFMQTFFGTGNYTTPPSDTTGGKATHKAGTNAEITLADGTVLSRATNTFDVDGISFEVTATTGADEAPITLTSNSDPTELVDKIKTFVDDYNALVDSLNSMLTEEKKADYSPLTDEQKAEMTEEQIKTWETEAKKGILRNDSTLRGILSDMRTTMYAKVEAAGISLYDIGITTRSLFTSDEMSSIDYKNDGKLVIDENKLREAIETNPDGVRLLFTAEDGIAKQLDQVIDRATNTTSNEEKRGSLVYLAGTEALTGDNTSVLGDKILAIDKYVTTLKNRLENEYNRYWKQFSALETAISRMSAQSSWLTQS